MSGDRDRTTTRQFPLRRDSVAAVRSHVTQVLSEWQLPSGVTESATHIASELAANSVRHGNGIGD
jgi:anti-sigma regulatory factor (Ser/Thr protein kinase)